MTYDYLYKSDVEIVDYKFFRKEDGFLGNTGKVMLSIGLVDVLQSFFTGKHVYEFINPTSVQFASDAATQIAIYAKGVAIDALMIGVGSHFYNSKRIENLEKKTYKKSE